MDHLISLYRGELQLQKARFILIEHEDAMVATVFKIVQPDGEAFVLKICSRAGDYFREAHFLNHFAGTLPVPRIVQLVEPKEGVHGAILMECLAGDLLKTGNLNEEMMHHIGSLLGRIHRDPVAGYGDLTQPGRLSGDPRISFREKFEEGMEECRNHLLDALLKKCLDYFDRHVDLLVAADGPCVVHRDFRPGNILVERGRVQGIIDWSSARGGFAEEDFCPLEFGEWSSGDKEAFLAGYATVRKVPNYGLVLPLLRLSRAIGAVGFCIKRERTNCRVYRDNRQFLESLFLNEKSL